MTATTSLRERLLAIADEVDDLHGPGMDGGDARKLGTRIRDAVEGLSTPPAGEWDDTARLDFIERTFSGMTNRERYLPVQMLWGKGCNGRTLRDACDKYMKRVAAEPATQEVG